MPYAVHMELMTGGDPGQGKRKRIEKRIFFLNSAVLGFFFLRRQFILVYFILFYFIHLFIIIIIHCWVSWASCAIASELRILLFLFPFLFNGRSLLIFFKFSIKSITAEVVAIHVKITLDRESSRDKGGTGNVDIRHVQVILNLRFPFVFFWLT